VANLSPTAYRMTTYFRRSFNVPDPAVVGGLQMRLQRDDGAVVYLNGRMVWSSNMPERFDAQTPASAAIEGSDEAEWHFMEVPSGLLLPGKNVVAVEVHQSDKPTAAEPGDLRFDLELSGVAAPPPPQDVLIAAGDSWAYWDGDSSTDVREAWTKTNFVDSSWKQGLARHGYGIDRPATGLNASSSGDAAVANPSVMFRKWFDIADPAAYGVLHCFLQVDDGAAVFLNGNRVFEHNIARGARTDSAALSCHRSLQSAPPAVTSECTTSELAALTGLCGRWQAGWGGFRGGDPVRNRQPGCILLKAECNTDRPGRAQGGSTGCLWNSGRESKRFH
jgi:hypothetical protein